MVDTQPVGFRHEPKFGEEFGCSKRSGFTVARWSHALHQNFCQFAIQLRFLYNEILHEFCNKILIEFLIVTDFPTVIPIVHHGYV